jgi:hypothetical protein
MVGTVTLIAFSQVSFSAHSGRACLFRRLHCRSSADRLPLWLRSPRGFSGHALPCSPLPAPHQEREVRVVHPLRSFPKHARVSGRRTGLCLSRPPSARSLLKGLWRPQGLRSLLKRLMQYPGALSLLKSLLQYQGPPLLRDVCAPRTSSS